MVMSTIQIRLTGEQIDVLRSMVGSGIYPSKSEAVRDAVRKYIRAFEQGLPIDQVETIEHEVQEEMKEMIQEEIKNYQNVKGTVDFYPEDKYIKEAVFTKLRDTAVRFNFNEIETPSFETLELLTAKSGEEIKTQIFTLEKRSTEQLGLRFDLTIPTTRLFIQKQKELPKPVKWFYIDRMWRYEKPQKGRLREFYQYGVEMYGSDKPEADAEVIALAIESLKNLGLTQKDIIVKINNRKLLEGLLLEIIPKEKMEDVTRLIDKSSKITDKEFIEELEKLSLKGNQIDELKQLIKLKGNPKEVIKRIKQDTDKIKSAVKEVEQILENLEEYKEFIILDLSVARGLAYYSGTVFEIFDRDETLRSLCGGGRYDDLVELFKGEKTPATGFGMGYETLRLLLQEKNLLPSVNITPQYFIASVGNVRKEVNKLAKKLRKNNIIETDLMERNLGKQMRFADSIGAENIIVIGENEIKTREYKIKDMKTGEQVVKKWGEI